MLLVPVKLTFLKQNTKNQKLSKNIDLISLQMVLQKKKSQKRPQGEGNQLLQDLQMTTTEI